MKTVRNESVEIKQIKEKPSRVFNRTIKVAMKAIIAGVLVAIGLSGCTSTKNDSGKMKVVTTIFAPYDFARQITNDKADVTMLLAPGAETHSYEPSPQDIIAISECDVFIYVGGENDTWLDGILETVENDHMEIIKLMDCVETVPEEIPEGMEAEDDHDSEYSNHEEDVDNNAHNHSDEEEWDEHVWTSPINAMIICRKMNEVFSKIDPENANEYQTNLDNYIAVLENLDNDFKEVVAEGKRKLLVFGDRFPLRYFVEEYNLDYYAAFPGCSSETEAGASTVAFLIDKVNDENIPVVFKIELSNGNIAQTISGGTDAEVMTFYSCHNVTKSDFDAGLTYVDLMKKNVDSLKIALN